MTRLKSIETATRKYKKISARITKAQLIEELIRINDIASGGYKYYDYLAHKGHKGLVEQTS